jgi:glutamate-1-semialdehyde 2,1-aminomutase
MAALAPDGAAFTGGTFSGNPFSIALGHRTLDLIENDPGMYARLRATSERLARGMRALFAARGLPYAVVQLESMVDFAFRPGPPVRAYDERAAADKAAFAAYYHAMLGRGVLLAPSPNELMFLSAAHGDREVDVTLEAMDGAFSDLRGKGIV